MWGRRMAARQSIRSSSSVGHGLCDRRGSLFLLIIVLLTFIGVGHWDAFFVVARQPPFQYSHLLFPISHHVLHLLLGPGRRSGPACWFKPSVSSALSTGCAPTAAKW